MSTLPPNEPDNLDDLFDSTLSDGYRQGPSMDPSVSASLGAPADPQTGDAESFSRLYSDEFIASTSLPDSSAGSYQDPYESSPGPDERRRFTRSPKKKAPKVTGPVAGVKPRASAVTVKLIPAASNFDLLEGAYKKIRSTRLLLEIVAGAIAAILIIMAGIGVRANTDASSNRLATTAANQTASTKQTNYDKLAQYGGVPLNAMKSDSISRLPALEAITNGQVNLQLVLADVNALTAYGDTLTNVTITQSSATATPGQATTVTTPAAPTFSISITASAPNSTVANTLLTNAENIPYLTNATSSLSGTSTAVIVTVTATINTNKAKGSSANMNLPSSVASLATGSTTTPTTPSTTGGN